MLKLMRITRLPAFVPALLLGAVLLSGCSQGPVYKVSILSEPPGATVIVKEVASGEVVRMRPAPTEVSLRFEEPDTQYLVTAEPPEEAIETHRARTLYLDRAGVEGLPPADRAGRERDLLLLLPEREYVELPHETLVFHPGKGWVSLTTRRRSFKSVLEADGSAPERIAALDQGSGFAGIALSPEGDKLAYAAFVSAPFEPELDQRDRRRRNQPPEAIMAYLREVTESNVFTVLIDGGGRESITSDSYLNFHPAFDGEWIAYCSTRDRRDRSDVFRRRAVVRGGVQKVTSDLRDRSTGWTAAAGGPGEDAGAPEAGEGGGTEGGRLAFTALAPGMRSLQEAEILTVEGPTGYRTLVANGVQPAVSPDGARIAYISEGNLWVADAEGAGAMQLTFDAAQIRSDYAASLVNPADVERHRLFEQHFVLLPYSHPAFSADGRWIFVAGMRNRGPEGRPNADIMAIRADGSGREVFVTTNPSLDSWPMPSRDGKWVYFVSNRGQQWSVWRVATPEAVRQGS